MRSITLSRGLLAGAVIIAAIGAHGLTGQEPNRVAPFMQMKLKHSQEVLKGLVLEDFDIIAKHSQEMSLLSQEASWQVLQTPDYLQHSFEFRRAADSLTQAAKKKNLDGCALAYVQLTMNCVNCHKYVRESRMAVGNLPEDASLPVFGTGQ